MSLPSCIENEQGRSVSGIKSRYTNGENQMEHFSARVFKGYFEVFGWDRANILKASFVMILQFSASSVSVHPITLRFTGKSFLVSMRSI